MSDLTPLEKRKYEKVLQMGGGYVLNFSNRTFQEFVLDTVNREIYAASYDYGSGSKANQLRGFWRIESNHIVGMLLNGLLNIYKDEARELNDDYNECRKIAARLEQDSPVIDIDVITPNSDGREFEILAKSVRDSIEANQPETGLDRLHTFLVKYIRVLCEKHSIIVIKEKPLHSIFGEYVKCLRDSSLVESEMAERILRSSISIFEAFNHVRNEQSLAHDNHTIGYDESIFIFNSITSAIRFLRSVERAYDATLNKQKDDEIDLPF
jgi:hypothetical protein